MAQDLFMHPQSCIIQELSEENNEPNSSSIEHIDVAPTATEASSPDNQQQINASESAASEPAADVPVSSAVDGGDVSNQSEADRVEQPVDPRLQQLLDDCERIKQEGNAAYGRGEYDEALQLYWQAIDQAPEDAQHRAVYLCNAAACYLKKEMWQLAAEQCTQALKLNENYLKALMRRAQALQQLDDLEHALADARRVLELEPGNTWAQQLVLELEPQVQQRQEKLKEEMIGKLKDLGNTLLGKIGLSLDNFKAEQDPASGGYSIKFVQ